MDVQTKKQERFSLDAATANQLSRAERRLGQVIMLEKLWQPWPAFSVGPLIACSAISEVRLRGYQVDIGELLALGPNPSPSRPVRPLRWAVGITLARRRLMAQSGDNPLIPSLVGQVYNQIEAPQFSRGAQTGATPDPASVDGASFWTLAPRWLAAGIPPLWAAGLALAFWEREGPKHPRRSLAGKSLMTGLAPSLGLPAHAFDLLGAGLYRAAAREPGGLEDLIHRVRKAGAWKRFVVVFLKAVELSAAQVVKMALKTQGLYQSHLDLIDTWVRAPRHPRRLLTMLVGQPVVDLPGVAQELDVTQRTAGLLAKKLVDQGILVEITGQRRGRRFAYGPLLQILQPGWSAKSNSEESD